MPLKPTRYRVKYKPRDEMWVVHKHHASVGFKKEAETKVIITKNNKYIEQSDKPPLIEAETVMGFGNIKDASSWLRTFIGLTYDSHNEIVIEQNKYVHKGGGTVGYTDINICLPDGRVLNIVPIELDA